MLYFVREIGKEGLDGKEERRFLLVDRIWRGGAEGRRGYSGNIGVLGQKDDCAWKMGNRFNGLERMGGIIVRWFFGLRRNKEAIYYNGHIRGRGNSGCVSGFSLGFVEGREAGWSGKARGKGYSLSMISTEWLIMFWIKRSLEIFGRFINFPEGDKKYIGIGISKRITTKQKEKNYEHYEERTKCFRPFERESIFECMFCGVDFIDSAGIWSGDTDKQYRGIAEDRE